MREAEDATGKPLAVLVDLPGPKVRLSTVGPDPFTFRPGQRFELRPEGEADERGASTTYPGLSATSRRATGSCSPTERSS